ncbi:uncharacterized protein [Venturia canescens]|uniref:uncharacterized protein n=1 Tax=Venturia canescens TaxID=32260 RepID=UPI001C9C3DD7|nr:uncharacterized protein LOC122418371 [Venturia canescens]
MQIKDKRAIVTGAASNLGIAFSRELLRNGAACVVMIDIRESIGQSATDRLNAEFGQNRAVFVPCNVSQNTEFDAVFKNAVTKLGGLDILVNNAQVVNEDDYSKAIEVNVTAVVRGTFLAVQQMGKDNGGKGGIVVNIASVLGLEACPQLPVYSTTKHAVISFSRSYSQPYHYRRTGVRIVVLCPGISETPVLENLENLESDSSDSDNIEALDISSSVGPNIHPQRLETVAHGLVYAIRCAQNGSIWVSEDGQPVYQVQLPDAMPQKEINEEMPNMESHSSTAEKPLEFANSPNNPFFSLFVALPILPENSSEYVQYQKSRRTSASEKAKELELINGLVCGKNVVITGGAAGLGYAFVKHFIQHGASMVMIFDIDSEAGAQAVKAVEKTYGCGKVQFVKCDTTSREQIADAFVRANERFEGGIDIVINNAGVLDERRWEREIAVNIGGMVNVASLAMYYMGKDQAGHGGVLVNIAQHIDYRWTAQLPVYTATKHAIIGLSQSLGAPYHVKKTGVRAMTLCPGLTETALTINSPNRLLSRVMKADFVKNLEELSIQTPYVVAQGLMSVLKGGRSGSTWVVENGRAAYEVYTPAYRSLRRCYKNNFVIVEQSKVTRGRPIREVCDNTRTGLMSCA